MPWRLPTYVWYMYAHTSGYTYGGVLQRGTERVAKQKCLGGAKAWPALARARVAPLSHFSLPSISPVICRSIKFRFNDESQMYNILKVVTLVSDASHEKSPLSAAIRLLKSLGNGGGIRGLSELLILNEIMSRLKSRFDSKEDLLPADVFHMIGGTSTGGLVALLLGRLRLTVPEAIAHYTSLAETIFTARKPFWKDGRFKASALEDSIKRVVEQTLGNANEKMDAGNGLRTRCKTFVCAVDTKCVNKVPTLFRSWAPKKDASHNCAIWQAARATTAAPPLFKQIVIGEPTGTKAYVDGALGCNNPIRCVISEAVTEFGVDRLVGCILSIGTGLHRASALPRPIGYERVVPVALMKVVGRLVTDGEEEAGRMEAQFAHSQLSPAFGGVMWIDGSSTATIKQSFLQAVRHMLPEIGKNDNLEPDLAVCSVLEEIARSDMPWLVVFDNVDDPRACDGIERFLPSCGRGLVIITSRTASARPMGLPVEIGSMQEDEALDLLRTIVSHPHLEQDHDEQARRVIMSSIPSVWRYRRDAKISNEARGDDHDGSGHVESTELSIATTWELSLKGLSGDASMIHSKTQLLITSAFLGGASIPESLFKAFLSSPTERTLPDWMTPFVQKGSGRGLDTDAFREAIAEMGGLYLLQTFHLDTDGMVWQLHPVVRDWAQIRNPAEDCRAFSKLVIDVIHESLSHYGPGWPLLVESRGPAGRHVHLRPHVEACFNNYNQEFADPSQPLGSRETAAGGLRIANFFCADGQYAFSEKILRTMVDSSPPDSPDRRVALRQLAHTLRSKRDLLEAAKLQEEAIKGLIPGMEDLDGALQLAELASTYRSMSKKPKLCPDPTGMLARSLQLAEQSVTAVARLQGDNSPEAALAKEILALTEWRVGNVEKALKLGEEVFRIQREALGLQSPHTLEAMENVGFYLMAFKSYNKARGYYEKALETKRHLYGPVHPATMYSERRIARCWRMVGDLSQARSINEDVLKRALQAYGKNHYDTKEAALGLWMTVIAEGLTKDAEVLEGEYNLELDAECLEWRSEVLQPKASCARKRKRMTQIHMRNWDLCTASRKAFGWVCQHGQK
ncbi:hypothetical protein CHGG_10581 [Chaetomium globosum CBS 148.51]|uniref:PNPLA domain-containing protein n=1 Tax=Chaetomium globosum (strain ATCC 6205 / CBS 148.51 / DSM 1962 / NBRC 6347 / NRRL 1970) TaxID=306901 RepID=Q2GN73_CHAGB|nr:uncharacterized protein CHGG_10581 [Chaetomium globosum CBS 148.51]EAQ84177.1 hypothetical protein CHGG_10581 [Chaetomium globosum CBS 148.51]